MILLQIQLENNFLPTHKPKFVTFLVFVSMNASFIAQINVSKRDAILASLAKQ